MLLYKFLIAFASRIPAFILYEFIVRTQIHCHRLSAFGATRNKFGRNTHILLLGNQTAYKFFVVVGCVMARLGTLKKTVIALRVEKPLFIEARLLKAVIHVRRNYKIIFVFDKFIQFVIYGFGGGFK